MVNRLQFISELADQTAHAITHSAGSWKQYLNTAAQIYKYPFNDQLLIYAQRPDATACVSMEVWNGHMRRWVKAGTKGIALIHKSEGGRPYLTYVFDVADTRPVRGERMPQLWEMRREHHAPVLAALEMQYGKTGAGDFGERLMAVGARAAAAAYREPFGGMDYDVQGDFPESADGRSLEACFRDTLTASVQYTLLSRCGLEPGDYLKEDALCGITAFSTPDALHHLGDAISTLAKSVLVEIGRAIRRYDRDKEKEALEKTEKGVEKPERSGYTIEKEKFNTLKHENAEKSTVQQAKKAEMPPSRMDGLDRAVPEDVIARALTSGGNEKGSLLRIVACFGKSPSMADAAAFLREEYGAGGKGASIAGRDYALWFSGEGIRIAAGRRAYVPGSIFVTWEKAAALTMRLLRDGAYATQELLDGAPENEYRELAGDLWGLRFGGKF